MDNNFEIKTIDASNLDQYGFFCYMSKPKSPGYLQKRDWLQNRFAEGMKIHILHEIGGRDAGFIEYLPGEYAWRAVHAPGYLVIHCLWVVGKAKGKGYGTRLIQACLEDARSQGKLGVVMVASDGVWLASQKIFLQTGFNLINKAPPSFSLLVHRFGSIGDPATSPSFPTNWEERLVRYGPGLTVVRTPQCPYIENGAKEAVSFAQEIGLPARMVELSTAQEVQSYSPSPYGVFAIVLDGQLFSYHYLLRKDFEKLMKARQEGAR